MKKLAFSIVAALFLVCACVEPVQAQVNNTLKYKKALFIGAHPDDPETCAGGTMILMKQMGCDVVSVYLTGGESGIKGKTHEEAAAIRRIESADACKVMGVRSLWVGQIDGYTEVNLERYAQMKAIIEAE
ncbi:MAG: PIG-L family deacetylase, partial [Bacteroidales bacterium]|nr:PIG-L family deacetylase [Candidatus Sodaliphilus fimicaballi]